MRKSAIEEECVDGDDGGRYQNDKEEQQSDRDAFFRGEGIL